MRLLISNSCDAARNAALEEQLYLAPAEDGTLLFYENKRSVVIGRNQNPFQECDYAWCRENGMAIIRRISGGGAVFHDLGNLNYAFFVPRADYEPDRFVAMIVEALHSLGASQARIFGQHSIWIEDRKLSGSAFALNGKTALLHGCILVDADLGELGRALHGKDGEEFQGASIASVKAPVLNLKCLLPNVTVSLLRDAIVARVQAAGYCLHAGECPNVEAGKFAMPEWNIDRTPHFTMTKVLPEGTLFMDVRAGRITEAHLIAQGTTIDLPELQGMRMEEQYK